MLLIVGSVGKNLIARHRRLRKFSEEDYDTLTSLIAKVDQVFVTPNTLTETSNLLAQHKDPERSLFLRRLRFVIEESEEVVIASGTASRNNSFQRLGLTDAALLEAVTVVGLSKEAFRNWKPVLPGFAHGTSRGTSFWPGDVLALIVVQRLTRGCGVRIGSLRTVASTIFVVCHETSWNLLVHRTLIVDLARQPRSVVSKNDPMPGDSTVMVCPKEPIIGRLRDHFVGSSPVAAEKAQGNGAELSDRASAGVQHR